MHFLRKLAVRRRWRDNRLGENVGGNSYEETDTWKGKVVPVAIITV
jgi:hypothetical protein